MSAAPVPVRGGSLTVNRKVLTESRVLNRKERKGKRRGGREREAGRWPGRAAGVCVWAAGASPRRRSRDPGTEPASQPSQPPGPGRYAPPCPAPNPGPSSGGAERERGLTLTHTYKIWIRIFIVIVAVRHCTTTLKCRIGNVKFFKWGEKTADLNVPVELFPLRLFILISCSFSSVRVTLHIFTLSFNCITFCFLDDFYYYSVGN